MNNFVQSCAFYVQWFVQLGSHSDTFQMGPIGACPFVFIATGSCLTDKRIAPNLATGSCLSYERIAPSMGLRSLFLAVKHSREHDTVAMKGASQTHNVLIYHALRCTANCLE